MKRTLLLIGLLCALVSSGFGASSGPFVLTATTSPCATITTSDYYATVGIRVTGTFSATLQPGVTIQGQPSTNTSVVPVGSTTSQNTITAAGAYTASVAGATTFQVCATGFVSGTATIWLNVSTGISAKAIVAAGGGVQSVTGTTNQVASSGGQNPVLSLPAAVVAPGSVQATKAFTSGINAMGNVTGAAVAIDLSLGNVVTMTLTGNVTSSSFTNATAAAGQEVTFIITQDGTGGRTFAWPTAVVPAGIAPYPALPPSAVTTVKATIDGSGNANFTANGPVIVFRQIVPGLVASNTASSGIYVPPSFQARYRATVISSCTTTGTTATYAVQVSSNGLNQNSPLATATTSTGIFRHNSTTDTIWAYTGGSTNNMGWSGTLTNAIGAAVFQVDFIVEYLGQ